MKQIISVLACCLFMSSNLCSQNLLQLSDWNIGSGSVGMFSGNGNTAENVREWGIAPNGKRAILWKAIPDVSSNADGGWNSSTFPIDHTKMYRFTTWMKKTNSHAGNSYFGCHAFPSTVTTLSGSSNSNPYFWYGDLPELNKWYLIVGYIHGSGDNSTASYGRIFDGETGKKVANITDYKFQTTSTSARHRSYLYYDTNTSDRQYFYAPRVDLVDGNEPPIEALGFNPSANFSTNAHAPIAGYFGGDPAASPDFTSHSYTANKWIKLAELTLNGNYSAAGITVDFYPRNSNHGDSRQQLNVQFRNNGGTGIETSSDISLIQFHGQQRTVRDAKVVHTSGTAVSMNKLSVWVQIGISWLSSIPIEVRKYGIVTFETTNQPFYSSITETGTVYNIKTYFAMSGNTFEVDGNIRAEEIKVQNVPSSDYVFEPEYHLRPIQEVETFINENKHLPDIPSAKEFKEKGVGLGEMDNMLLRKVEELTLYVIEQSKKIKAQSERLMTKDEEIEELKAKDKEFEKLKVMVEVLMQKE